MMPFERLDPGRARLPVGVAVGDHRDRRLRPGCRGLRQGLHQRPLGRVDDGLERGCRLGGRVDRVDLHGVHGAERHQRLALAVEEVAALAERALEPEGLSGGEVRVPGRAGRRGGHHPALAVGGEGDGHGVRPRHVAGQRPGDVEGAGGRVAVARDVARGDGDLRVAEVLDRGGEGRLRGVVGERHGREVLGGPCLRVRRGGSLARRRRGRPRVGATRAHRRCPRRPPARRRRPVRCESSWAPVNYEIVIPSFTQPAVLDSQHRAPVPGARSCLVGPRATRRASEREGAALSDATRRERAENRGARDPARPAPPAARGPGRLRARRGARVRGRLVAARGQHLAARRDQGPRRPPHRGRRPAQHPADRLRQPRRARACRGPR